MQEIIKSSAQKLGYSALKAGQFEVVSQFVSGKDVFAVLPTGLAKASVLPFFRLYLMQLKLLEIIMEQLSSL